MKLKQVIVGLAIAIIFTLFINYGIMTFYDRPLYDDFCPNLFEITNEIECSGANGEWFEYAEGSVPRIEGETGNCNNKMSCNEAFDTARESYSKVYFIITLILGLTALIGGIFIEQKTINLGALVGGLLTLFVGTISYWEFAEDLLRFVILGITLVILIYVA